MLSVIDTLLLEVRESVIVSEWSRRTIKKLVGNQKSVIHNFLAGSSSDSFFYVVSFGESPS